jgi:hypothetical protein
MRTDDAGTPGNKNWEINISAQGALKHSQSSYALPDIDINYGVGETMQLKYEIPWIFQYNEDADDINGLGNSGVAFKWRFLEERDYGIGISIFPELEFNNPTSSADRGLVDKGTKLFLPVEIGNSFEDFSAAVQVGYIFQEYGDNKWSYGLVAGYPVSKSVELCGEIYGTTKSNLSENETFFNLGTRWNFYKFYSVLFSVGRSIAGNDPIHFQFYIGLRLGFKTIVH